MEKPSILGETENFAIVFKPPRMHSAPSHNGGDDTLLDWYAGVFPPMRELSGRKAGEGGLLHRLDFETQGLVLFAKNQKSLDTLLAAQEQGQFIKEYSAITMHNTHDASFPPPPQFPLNERFVIESCFRPFGPGRKQVRPVTGETKKEHSGPYQTQVVRVIQNENGCVFTIRLAKGFRHQIRCHLAWIGYPVLNDPIYGNGEQGGFLALRSHGLAFPDPETGEMQKCWIEPLSSERGDSHRGYAASELSHLRAIRQNVCLAPPRSGAGA